MACASCGQRYKNMAKRKATARAQRQNVVVAPQPTQGDVVTPPAQPDIIAAGQVVQTQLSNTDNKAQTKEFVSPAIVVDSQG